MSTFRPKMNTLSWPVTPKGWADVDAMLEQLFKHQRELEELIAAGGTGGGAEALDDLSDVDTSGLSSGDVLTYDGAQWVPQAPSSVTNIDDLGDVVITTPASGQYLRYNGTNWINQALQAIALDDLSDVTISGAASGEYLKYNGSAWVNATLSAIAPPLAAPRQDWYTWFGTWAAANNGLINVGNTDTAQSISSSGSANSTFDSTLGLFRRLVTGAVSSNASRLGSASNSIVRTAAETRYIAVIRTGSDITNVRFWCGLAATTGFLGTNTPNLSYIMFRYSTGASDGGWVGVCGTATASLTVSGTVASIAASTVYVLSIRVPAGGASAFFSVNGGAETQVSTNMPASSTDMGVHTSIETLTGGARTMDWQATTIYNKSGASALVGAF